MVDKTQVITLPITHQNFDNRLEDEPQVGTPIRQSLVSASQIAIVIKI